MPVNLYYTQKVRGFQKTSVKYSTESVEIRLKRTKHQCPYCGSTVVTVELERTAEAFRFPGTVSNRTSAAGEILPPVCVYERRVAAVAAKVRTVQNAAKKLLRSDFVKKTSQNFWRELKNGQRFCNFPRHSEPHFELKNSEFSCEMKF